MFPFALRILTALMTMKWYYAVDIYPRYGSDVGAAWSAGNDVKGALIGPGVHASHGMERTHYKGMENTIQLILAYLGC